MALCKPLWLLRRKDSKTLRLGGGVQLLVIGEEGQCEAGVAEKAGACKVDGIEGTNAGQRARPADHLIIDGNLGDGLREFHVASTGEATALPHFGYLDVNERRRKKLLAVKERGGFSAFALG